MRAAGAVAVGKTNTPEFGAGSHTFNRVHGVTRNPWGLGRSAGGSSGGAAVALACRMVATADGSDTGGSLRNPAAWNNVVGFRPTVRVVPHVGPGNAWLPISAGGPMGRTVDDVALLLGVLAAPDARDPMHRPLDIPGRCDPPDRPLRVAWSPDLGVPVEATQLGVLGGRPPGDGRPRVGRRRRRAGAGAGQRLLPHAAGVEHRQRADAPARTTGWTRSRRRSRTRSAAARRCSRATSPRPTTSSACAVARAVAFFDGATTCSPAP